MRILIVSDSHGRNDYVKQAVEQTKKGGAIDALIHLGDVEDDYEDRLYVYKVNTNFDGELAEEYDVTANPTLLFVKDGVVKDRSVGAVKPAELTAWVEKNL